jgi:hypothetical protein
MITSSFNRCPWPSTYIEGESPGFTPPRQSRNELTGPESSLAARLHPLRRRVIRLPAHRHEPTAWSRAVPGEGEAGTVCSDEELAGNGRFA